MIRYGTPEYDFQWLGEGGYHYEYQDVIESTQKLYARLHACKSWLPPECYEHVENAIKEIRKSSDEFFGCWLENVGCHMKHPPEPEIAKVEEPEA